MKILENLTNVIIFGSIHHIDEIKHAVTSENIYVYEYPSKDLSDLNTIYLSGNNFEKKGTIIGSLFCDTEHINKKYSINELLNENKKGELFFGMEEIVPLFFIRKTLEMINIYSLLRHTKEDIIFIKTASISQKEDMNLKKLIEYAKSMHKKNHVFLGNHQCYYTKNEPKSEIEYKFNLNGENVDPWILTNKVYDEIKNEQVKDFILEYRDEFQKWDYMNYMFKIYGNETERGYISFIPQTNNTYLIKRKIYGKDTLTRKEIHYKNIAIEMPLEEYVTKHFKVKNKAFPPFRRIRYDINLECVMTGNVHGIFFDYITIEGKNNILRQCEIEYLRTRSLFKNDEHRKELEFLNQYIKEFLYRNNINFESTFFSKLSFMEQVCI